MTGQSSNEDEIDKPRIFDERKWEDSTDDQLEQGYVKRSLECGPPSITEFLRREVLLDIGIRGRTRWADLLPLLAVNSCLERVHVTYHASKGMLFDVLCIAIINEFVASTPHSLGPGWTDFALGGAPSRSSLCYAQIWAWHWSISYSRAAGTASVEFFWCLQPETAEVPLGQHS
ncbi:hypothetical protein K438DRAFT_1767769 [Mycena galopus ATCC 62051]|nr:hypothetical protein K438DRAFT_1767769 [Mycena galopus ATCC 62051]